MLLSFENFIPAKKKDKGGKKIERGKVCGLLFAANTFIIYEEFGKCKHPFIYSFLKLSTCLTSMHVQVGACYHMYTSCLTPK